MSQLDHLVAEIRACRICREMPKGKPLPHEPRPVLQVSGTARILIAGQAPGTRVHASGKPFTDPSGDRLRDWLGVGHDIFYDPARIAILPMGFCFPGLDKTGGDLPPRTECAPAWRNKVLALMPQVEMILTIGLYAQRYHLSAPGSVRETVANWRQWAAGTPKIYALPHPSWRNNGWLKKNPWFEEDVLPDLRREIAV
ncbi:MAG: uracil-DNA glycosylase family protein, partial [Aestuariivirga sp.]